MDYTLESLLMQLGINDTNSLIALTEEHTPLEPATFIADANFWNHSQSAFLREAIDSDGPWSVAVGQLDALTRKE